MDKVYIIIEDNGYDGFELPFNEEFYLTEDDAETVCKMLNIKSSSSRDYYQVHELNLAANH